MILAADSLLYTSTETGNNQSFCARPHCANRRGMIRSPKRKVGGSPDDASLYCSGKVIASPGCKQSPGSRGDKNWITITRSSASVKVVKLLRTDTTLDLSQKARVVRNRGEEEGPI